MQIPSDLFWRDHSFWGLAFYGFYGKLNARREFAFPAEGEALKEEADGRRTMGLFTNPEDIHTGFVNKTATGGDAAWAGNVRRK